jgi:hypothetical protein
MQWSIIIIEYFNFDIISLQKNYKISFLFSNFNFKNKIIIQHLSVELNVIVELINCPPPHTPSIERKN